MICFPVEDQYAVLIHGKLLHLQVVFFSPGFKSVDVIHYNIK